MITVHINARDHEEAHVASAKFILPAAAIHKAVANKPMDESIWSFVQD